MLYDPLADRATTSALRPWPFHLQVGDSLNGICTGDERTWLGITGSPTRSQPAVLDTSFDFTDSYPDIPATQTISPERPRSP